ncbi:DedA family protein [Candidatus Nomurabacteria bacterium]|nr:DedA family protein [Candidatus Nomurabacteria bacterium]
MLETKEIINQLGSLSYFGIFIVSILSNVIIPIPEEGVLLVLGFLSGTPAVNGFIMVPVVFLGLLISDIIMYSLARHGSKIVNFLYKKVFASRLEDKKEWIETNINKVVFFSRFLVQLRFLGPFFAGHNKMPFRKFLVYDALALAIYVPLYVFLGWYFHNRVELIVDGIGKIRNIIILAVVFILIITFLKFSYNFFIKKILNTR